MLRMQNQESLGETMLVVWSSTERLRSVYIMSRGLLDRMPVSEYWPEYGVGSKAATTVKMFLNHTADYQPSKSLCQQMHTMTGH